MKLSLEIQGPVEVKAKEPSAQDGDTRSAQNSMCCRSAATGITAGPGQGAFQSL